MIKVSIIIPIYNAEQYLRDCLESILAQTLAELEIICIDDGSTDHTRDIIQEYRKNDLRIKVFHQSNQGAGVARNLGLEKAEGEYVAFLDSDDYYVEPDALRQMYEICKNNNVAVCGSSIQLLRNGVMVEDTDLADVKKDAEWKSILCYRDYQFDYGYCGFIFKRSVILKNEIVFPSYRRFQDPPFMIRIMTAAAKFSFSGIKLYCYRTPNVVTRFDQNNVLDLLRGIIDNLEFAISNKLNLLFQRTCTRLNIEYAEIICHNINVNSTEILELLLRANTLIKQQIDNEEYMISPLKKILSSVLEVENYDKQKMDKLVESSKRIYVYGAGKATKDFLHYLENKNQFSKVAAIIVSNKEENPTSVNGVNVISLDEYKYLNGDIILIAVTNIHQQDIVHNLKSLKIMNFEIVNIAMLYGHNEEAIGEE